MKTYKFLNLLLFLSVFVISCSKSNEDEIITDVESNFTEESFSIYEELSSYYPKGDVVMTFSKTEEGLETVKFSLTGESLKMAQLGQFAKTEFSKSGDECSGPMSCGRLIKDCLNNGQDALISNGTRATYCVTCKDPQ
ncbi:hypothetical protein [Psychroflexus tropicus]|uniref:hypothetical protein n=1 Tax=Psychroflexus tropicus TaxID=197345 RepID=UPI000364777F|nr:hypothetical protein [Psychroflexus tropicus]